MLVRQPGYRGRRITGVGDVGARDQEIVAALNEIVATELRWGFWKCFDRLRQLGKPWNHKRVHRVYRQMRLNHKRRTKKRYPVASGSR